MTFRHVSATINLLIYSRNNKLLVLAYPGFEPTHLPPVRSKGIKKTHVLENTDRRPYTSKNADLENADHENEDLEKGRTTSLI